jgi:hypothetical protein
VPRWRSACRRAACASWAVGMQRSTSARGAPICAWRSQARPCVAGCGPTCSSSCCSSSASPRCAAPHALRRCSAAGGPPARNAPLLAPTPLRRPRGRNPGGSAPVSACERTRFEASALTAVKRRRRPRPVPRPAGQAGAG